MTRRLTAPPPAPDTRSHWDRWAQCCDGRLPAEALSARDRDDLVSQLHQLGWTDVQIATHTRMTTYTTGRIRARLGLAPNQREGAA